MNSWASIFPRSKFIINIKEETKLRILVIWSVNAENRMYTRQLMFTIQRYIEHPSHRNHRRWRVPKDLKPWNFHCLTHTLTKHLSSSGLSYQAGQANLLRQYRDFSQQFVPLQYQGRTGWSSPVMEWDTAAACPTRIRHAYCAIWIYVNHEQLNLTSQHWRSGRNLVMT